MELTVTMALNFCKDCKQENRLFEIKSILEWRGADNYLSGLSYDPQTQQITVNKDSLMRAIQLANPGQQYRDIRLAEDNEFRKMQGDISYQRSDYTSDAEKLLKEAEDAEM